MMGAPLLETLEKKFNYFKNNSSNETISVLPIQLQAIATNNQNNNKLLSRRRELTGTPDVAAEVIALPPTTLMATNQFVWEICNKGFQRDQKLQLHRRGNNLPWKLRQRSRMESRMRMYIFPEQNCIHHLPACALGDLTGIKKHHSRKHGEKKWTCDKCLKKYALQSDWKSHCDKSECETIFFRLKHVSLDDSVCIWSNMEYEFGDDNNKQPCVEDRISTLPKLKAPAVYIDEGIQAQSKCKELHSFRSISNPCIPTLQYSRQCSICPYGHGAMANGRGPMPMGMQMVPMVLPDGRIGYVFQQPGVHIAHPPQPLRRNDRSNGSEPDAWTR